MRRYMMVAMLALVVCCSTMMVGCSGAGIGIELGLTLGQFILGLLLDSVLSPAVVLLGAI